MTSAHQKLLLHSLGYNKLDSLNTHDTKCFRSLIAWLEHTKIRSYTPADRAPLSNLASLDWEVTFAQYLDDLECPLDYDAASAQRQDILDWLLHHAVDLLYEDHAEELDALPAPPPTALAKSSVEGNVPAFSDLNQPGVHEAVASLLRTLGLDSVIGSTLPQQLAAVKQALSEQVLPTLKDSQRRRQEQQSSNGSGDAVVQPANLGPLGFSTGDEKVDLAATILRMLLIKDLRSLQTQIDDMIVQVQEFTANPRINTSLGKVGS